MYLLFLIILLILIAILFKDKIVGGNAKKRKMDIDPKFLFNDCDDPYVIPKPEHCKN